MYCRLIIVSVGWPTMVRTIVQVVQALALNRQKLSMTGLSLAVLYMTGIACNT